MEAKISLTLMIPGAQLLTQEDCDKDPKNSYNMHKLNVSYEKGTGKNKKVIRETLNFKTRKNRLISQHINISKESYEGMLANATEANKQKKWHKLPDFERLKQHFDLIAQELGAVSYRYEILDD